MATNTNNDSVNEIRADKTYRIRSVQTGGFIRKGESKGSLGTGTTYRFYVDTASTTTFALVSDQQAVTIDRMKVDQASYRIVHIENGFGIGIPTLKAGAVAVQDYDVERWAAKYGKGGADKRYVDFARWQIVAVNTPKGTCYRMINALTGGALGKHTVNNYVRPYAPAEYAGKPWEKDPTLWWIEVAAPLEINEDRAAASIEPNVIPSGPLTQEELREGVAKSLPWKTVEVARLPFFVVADKALTTPANQMSESPYYYLFHEQRYLADPTEFGQVLKGRAVERSVTLEEGTSRSNVEAFEQTTGIEVSTTGGFAFKGIGLSISGAVNRQLGIRHEVSITDRQSTQVKETIREPARDYDYYYQQYHVESRFTLKRMDLSTRVGEPLTYVETDLPTFTRTGKLE